MLRFANPLAFLLLLVVVAIVIVARRLAARRRPRIVFPEARLLEEAGLARGRRFRLVPMALRVAALVLLVASVARPQSGHRRVEVTSEGVDIVIALDISGSMRAEDFKPQNRLHVAKEVIRSFIDGRQSDRIGLVIFAATSFVQCPLTLDYGVLRDLVTSIDFGMLEDGTAIGSALASAVNRLRESKAKSRVVILVTDGVNNAGNIDPETASQLARAMGVKVYTIGVGRPGGRVPFPVEDPFFGTRRVMMEAQLDEPLLKKMAETTGGAYYRAMEPNALRSVFDRISELEKTKIESTEFVDYEERVAWFLIPAMALLCIEAGLAATRYLAIP
jgi:Ca-activated chloride channel family protein